MLSKRGKNLPFMQEGLFTLETEKGKSEVVI